MAELKTKPTNQSAKDFLNTVEPEEKRLDSFMLLELFEKITGEKAVMWAQASSALTNVIINTKVVEKVIWVRLASLHETQI